MSILNYWCGEDRALVVADTLCRDSAGAYSEISKLATILHAGLVVAARGHPLFFHLLVPLLQRATDYESAKTRMLEAIPATLDELKRRGESAEEEVVICGYSEVAGRYDGTVYRVTGDRVQAGSGRQIALPWLPEWGPPGLGQRSTPDLMKDLMIEQLRRVREAQLEGAIGGRMLVAELSRGRILLTEAHLK